MIVQVTRTIMLNLLTQPTYEMTLGSNFHKTYFDSLFRNTFSVPFISPLGYKPLRL